jgi:RsiW-degrading membrane proteinase PrsW (M82 family)
MTQAKKNARFIFIIHFIAVLALWIYYLSLERGKEKDVAVGIVLGVVLSGLIQVFLFVFKPELYGNKKD